MKKILFVIESLNIGGMEKVQVDIANALVSRGYDVTILHYMPNNEDNFQKQLDERVHVVYKERKPFPILRKTPYIYRYYRNYKWEKRASAKKLYKYYVGNQKFDVEIAFYRGPSVKIISGSTNKKSIKIAWVHTDFKLCDPKSIMLFFNNMEEVKEAYGKLDKVVCVSEKAKESFIEVIGCEHTATTVYNMISVNDIVNKSKEECARKRNKFTIISVGRFIEAKGYDRLLKVVKRLEEEKYFFEVWLVGCGREEEKLKSFVSENKLESVKFCGYQENPYSYMAQADLFVCSSIREGFSLVVAEAMACGLPVLSTKCTGPTEILDDGKYGVLVENDEEALYKGLKMILQTPQEIQNLRASSQQRSKRFDTEKIIEEIEKIFRGE